MTPLLAFVLGLAVLVLLVVGLLAARARVTKQHAQRPVPAPRAQAPRQPVPDEGPERVRREIEARVQNLRLAREQAEHWVPPAVDAVQPRQAPTPASDTGFADTSIQEDQPRR